MQELLKEILPIVTQSLFAIISAAVAVYVPVIARRISLKLKINLSAEQEKQFCDIVYTAVDAIEQIYFSAKTNGELYSPGDRKADAMKRIARELILSGISKTLPQIEDKIEAAIHKNRVWS